MFKLLFAYFALLFIQTSAFFTPKQKPYPTTGNTGKPVFVTPYIEDKEFEYGRGNCSVKPPLKGNVTSYAGFFTVKESKTYNSNMFFWFFPSESDPSAPIVLWLQGGPGASSLYGLFEEHGPFYVKPKHGLKLRKHYWSKSLNVVYIDNPVGTGFSFTTSDDGYSKSENDVAENLLVAVTQFISLFEMQKNDFYVAGESYAGKYVPALAYAIDKSNKGNRGNALKINLKGISIGNGLCDPQNMMVLGKYLYQIGLIDSEGLTSFQKSEKEIVDRIKNQQYKQAFEKFDTLLNGDLTPYKTLFYNLTGFEYYFNYRFSEDDSLKGDFSKYVQSDLARRAIHVGNETFHTDKKVEMFLLNDIMQSVKPLVEYLLNKKYRILFYNGQLDIIVAYPTTVEFLKALDWSGKKEYYGAQRQIFRVDGKIAGYYKQANNLIEVLVRDAGHMVPKDQPIWAYELITRFVNNKPL